MTPLMEAAYILPHVYGVQTLLALGANPNLQNDNGQTALMLALEAGHLASAEAISFASGSNLLLTDNQGKKAIDYLSKDMENTACGKKVVERTRAQEHALREQTFQLHVN